jgi:hypothetical protein
MGDIVPRNQLVKQGVQGIAGIGGGVGLLILRAIAAIGEGAFSVAGLIVGGVVTVAGFVIMSSPEDRRAGMITIGAGALTLAASLPLVGGIANAFMWIGGFGLIIAGAISLFRFLRNLRRRSR